MAVLSGIHSDQGLIFLFTCALQRFANFWTSHSILRFSVPWLYLSNHCFDSGSVQSHKLPSLVTPGIAESQMCSQYLIAAISSFSKFNGTHVSIPELVITIDGHPPTNYLSKIEQEENLFV